VNTLDFNFLAANFNGMNKSWLQGDYNYDGNVDTLDFNALAAAILRYSVGDRVYRLGPASGGSVVVAPFAGGRSCSARPSTGQRWKPGTWRARGLPARTPSVATSRPGTSCCSWCMPTVT